MNEIFTSMRLGRYRLSTKESEAQVLKRYLWNIQLSEALYPSLAIFEVVFRNRVDTAIASLYGSNWLHEEWEGWTAKQTYQREELSKKRRKLKVNAGRGHLVAELNLGFWISLFDKPNKPLFWDKPGIFEKTFPSFKGAKLDRAKIIVKRLNNIRLLRNRISHHEAIYDFPRSLNRVFEELSEMILWLSEDADCLHKKASRFQTVWSQNPVINP